MYTGTKTKNYFDDSTQAAHYYYRKLSHMNLFAKVTLKYYYYISSGTSPLPICLLGLEPAKELAEVQRHPLVVKGLIEA